jgi:hypothetical protein
MKQTAVDWLFLNLKSHFEYDGDLLEAVQMSYQQAKEMEKQKMIEFAQSYAVIHCMGEITKNAEKYYNETYGGNK